MKLTINNPMKWVIAIVAIITIVMLVWLLGLVTNWPWNEFWSSLISNGLSSAAIGVVLYWIITRPDEKNARLQRRNQALAMLKWEFEENLRRARSYVSILEDSKNDYLSHYPFRFRRGAWNALRESGFLPQFDDIELVVEMLRVNEIITTANQSLSQVRNVKAKNRANKEITNREWAKRDCSEICELLMPILEKLEVMELPEVKVTKMAEPVFAGGADGKN